MCNLVLLVDDNTDQLIILKFFLKLAHPEYEYLIFSSGESVLQFLQSSDANNHSIKLIISDFYMYPLNGLELYQKVKEINNSITFILFSAFLSDGLIKDAKMYGITSCISKKFDISESVHLFDEFLQPQSINV